MHLSIAHAWNALVVGKDWKALGHLGWPLILWGNYLLALQFVLDKQVSTTVMYSLYASGFAAVILFSAPQKNFFKAIGAGVGALGLGIVNSFVDVVSYVRLFAVGASTVAVAQSFNGMAAGIQLPGWLTPIVVALILLFGHGLNIMLGAMGVIVHGIRLNVLEFSGHLGMQWTGVPYRPLKK